MKIREGLRGVSAFALVVAAASFASCEAELGELPARCDANAEPACPEGYDCIHGVCARPGTAIPSTVTTLQYLRPVDLRLVPDGDGAIVAWQIYRYDLELHDFAGARLSADGRVSDEMTLVAEYPANANYLEPYFDVLSVSPGELLLSVGAAPADAAPESRLSQFAVHLPAAGDESSGASFDPMWELRMRTIGYGAVSRPRLARSGDRVALAYFESQAQTNATLGSLATFLLEADGSRVDPPACEDASCCQANGCFGLRSDSSVAVGVVDALVEGDDVWWVIDDTRPSFARLAFDATTPEAPSTTGAGGGDGGGGATSGNGGAGGTGAGDGAGGAGGGASTSSGATTTSTGAGGGAGGGAPADADVPRGALPRLAIPVFVDGATLYFLQPSARGGDGLADDRVDGDASLWRVSLDEAGAPSAPEKVGDLPAVRDTPRPAWIAREGKPALLVTPGANIDAPSLQVLEVDTATAKTTRVATIDRLAQLPVAVLQAAVINGKLFVTWVDESEDSATVRAAVLDEP